MKKILIIEDETELREEIADILKFEGYTVLQANDGQEGLNQAKTNYPDLILCDIMMPEIDGFEVLERWKKDFSFVSVPFIFITALTERGNFRKGMENGADDYLTKPFSRAELLKTINTRLEIYSNFEKKISDAVEKIENKLENELARIKNEVNKKKEDVLNVSIQNEILKDELKDKKYEMMQEMLRITETKNVMQNLHVLIENELSKEKITEKERAILSKLKNRLKDKSILTNNWSIFQLKFNQIYPRIIEKLTQKYSTLTQYDLVFISATKMGMNTNQIADLLNISVDSVRKSRYRLKKKLQLKKEDSFISFIHSLV